VPQRERIPPSQRVETALRERIAAGEWQTGDQLPAVATLAKQYAVSRATVAKALHRIEADELVEITAAWGTFRT
jgi:DNA-binding GntR family transcriptional regulator